MTSITYIGMDVDTTNFTLCCYSFEDDKVYATVQVKPEYTQIAVPLPLGIGAYPANDDCS